MNKHINKLLLIVVCGFLFTSCKTVLKSHTADYDYLYVTKQGIMQRPLVTDLEVGKTKQSLTKTYENVSIAEAKENALGDFVQQNNCDVAIQPFFETNTITANDKTSVTISITAYPGFFRNIRNYDPKDSTNAFWIHNSSSIETVPVVAPTAAVEPKVATTVTSETSIVQKTKSGKGAMFGINAIYAMPTGDYSDYYKSSFGLGINWIFPTSPKADITLRADYIGFSGKTITTFYPPSYYYTNTVENSSNISARLGYKYKTPINVFVEPQLGYSLFSGSGDEKGISYGIFSGYDLTKKFEVGLLYNHTSLSSSSFNYIGLRAGFYF